MRDVLETKKRTVELELLLLSAILDECEDELISEACTRLREDFFVFPEHQRIFAKLQNAFIQTGHLPSVTFIKSVHPAFETVPVEDSLTLLVPHFLEVVLERKLLETSANLHKRSLFDPKGALVETSLALDRLNEILGPGQDQAGEVIQSGELKASVLKHLDSLDATGDGDIIRGIPAPWREFNRLTFGWCPGLHGVIGEEKNMKTWFSLVSAVHAWSQGNPTVIASKEMSKDQMSLRVAALLTRVDYRKLVRGDLADDELNSVLEALDALKGHNIPLYIERLEGFGQDVLVRFRSLIRQYEAKCALFDGLYLAGMRKWDLTGELSAQLAEAGDVHKCAILATMQSDEESKVRYSKAIEQDAQSIIFVELNRTMSELAVQIKLTREGDPGRFLINAIPCTNFREKGQPRMAKHATSIR